MSGVDWRPQLVSRGKPLYVALADAIEGDLRAGRLSPSDRLPSQRDLADALGLNFTTIARGYSEAQRRGLIDSHVGRGTFVRVSSDAEARIRRRPHLVDQAMNLPPEPDDPELVARMRQDLEALGEDLVALLRYQPTGGSAEDKAAALDWLERRGVSASAETLLLSPGAHAAILAILGELTSPGEAICCEEITYPGLRQLAAQLGLRTVGLPTDAMGIDPAALARAAVEHRPRLLYCNPTLLNPTTATMSAQRRAEIVDVARRCGVWILEDDAYGFIPEDPPPALAMLGPEITYHVSGLAKCVGAGLRLAYVVPPEPRASWRLSSRLRAANVMASPLTTALATRWIRSGVADAILASIRTTSRRRQQMASSILPRAHLQTDPEAFHLWVSPPAPWSRSRMVDWMRGQGLGVVASDAFSLIEPPPEAFRLCLGGTADDREAGHALHLLADAFEHPPNLHAGAF